MRRADSIFSLRVGSDLRSIPRAVSTRADDSPIRLIKIAHAGKVIRRHQPPIDTRRRAVELATRRITRANERSELSSPVQTDLRKRLMGERSRIDIEKRPTKGLKG